MGKYNKNKLISKYNIHVGVICQLTEVLDGLTNYSHRLFLRIKASAEA